MNGPGLLETAEFRWGNHTAQKNHKVWKDMRHVSSSADQEARTKLSVAGHENHDLDNRAVSSGGFEMVLADRYRRFKRSSMVACSK